MTLHTAFLLMAQYNGRAIITLADVCRDYFSHLKPEKLVRKVMTGQIPLPIVHIERSQKSAKGVPPAGFGGVPRQAAPRGNGKICGALQVR